MKKWTILACACAALAGCIGPYTDLDKAAETRTERRMAYRQEFGCPMTDDHQAYRECVLRTYAASHPKTYRTEDNADGKSVAVLKDTLTQTYDRSANTYKTERVVVIETEERLEPLPQIVPAPVVPAEVVVETTEVVEKPATEPAVELEPKESWWDTYQKNQPAEEPKCPCEDPNDPCPQCVDK